MILLSTLLALSATQAAGTVEVPFKLGNDAIIVDATVNSRTASLLFDTGFSGAVVLNDSIDIGPASGNMTLRDFVGEFQAKTVKIKSLKLGQKAIDSKDMTAVQQPLAHMSFGYGTHTDGIMGFEVIKDNVTEINFQNKKFIFYPSTLDITKRVPDNKKTFLCRLLPTGMNSMEMTVVASTGKKMTLALDTGNAFYATTHKDVLERIGLWEPGKKAQYTKLAGVASGAVESWYKYMKDLTIFGVPVKTSVWSIIDAPSSSAEGDGTVGFGFLKNFNITIDMARRRIWLENFTGTADSDPEGDLGMSVGFDNDSKRVRVYRVSPDSPAAKAGIKPGDAIISVDGKELADVGDRALDAILNGPVDSKVTIAYSRNNILQTIQLVRKPLVND